MKDFIRFCEAAGLQWYLAFGAAIGAERNKGMIPWDDDIDVYMPREDYEKFLALSGRVAETAPGLSGEYDIFSVRNCQGDYPVPFAKFTDMNSTIWEQEKYPFVFGMFIDVFPLDKVSDDMQANKVLKDNYNFCFNNYRRGLRSHTFREWIELLVQGRLSKFAGVVKDVLWMRLNKEKSKDEFNAVDKGMAESEGDMRIVLAAYSSVEKICHPARLFDGYRVAPFEDFTVRLPIGNDAILRQIYGDYMQLPPKYERISTHGHYFVDLTRRMTIQEIKEEIRSGRRDKYAGR